MAYLPDNLKLCSVCGRRVPKEPTRNERELHFLEEELEDAVLMKSQWVKTMYAARRRRDQATEAEALEQVHEFANEIDRIMYYVEIIKQRIDNERGNK